MESRKEQRHSVEIPGRYRCGSGAPRDVTVTDLSESGCKMFERFCNLSIGKFISIRIGSIGPIDAQVKWRDGMIAGLEFAQRLHPSVLEHMRFTLD
jgi:hypothetical protein